MQKEIEILNQLLESKDSIIEKQKKISANDNDAILNYKRMIEILKIDLEKSVKEVVLLGTENELILKNSHKWTTGSMVLFIIFGAALGFFIATIIFYN